MELRKRAHNDGIDLLRLVSMLYVIILHALSRGGILEAVSEGSFKYNFAWALEMWAYCAVNIFGMISGYVGYTDAVKKYNYANYLITWLQVVFYGVSITVIAWFINPDFVTWQDLQMMFLPVTNDLYWYFTAYTGLFLLIPLLNAGIRQSDRAYLKKLFLAIIFLFSIYDFSLHRFGLGKGYTFVWLVLLYLLGAIIKKCGVGMNVSLCKGAFFICACCLVSWSWKIFGKEFSMLGINITNKIFQSYVAPPHVIAAVCHIIVFSKLQICGFAKKVIHFAAPGAFAVYLINLQFVVWTYIMNDTLMPLANRSVPVIFLGTVGFSVVFVIVSVLIDHIRQKLFLIFKVKPIMQAIVQKLSAWATVLASKLL